MLENVFEYFLDLKQFHEYLKHKSVIDKFMNLYDLLLDQYFQNHVICCLHRLINPVPCELQFFVDITSYLCFP